MTEVCARDIWVAWVGTSAGSVCVRSVLCCIGTREYIARAARAMRETLRDGEESSREPTTEGARKRRRTQKSNEDQ